MIQDSMTLKGKKPLLKLNPLTVHNKIGSLGFLTPPEAGFAAIQQNC